MMVPSAATRISSESLRPRGDEVAVLSSRMTILRATPVASRGSWTSSGRVAPRNIHRRPPWLTITALQTTHRSKSADLSRPRCSASGRSHVRASPSDGVSLPRSCASGSPLGLASIDGEFRPGTTPHDRSAALVLLLRTGLRRSQATSALYSALRYHRSSRAAVSPWDQLVRGRRFVGSIRNRHGVLSDGFSTALGWFRPPRNGPLHGTSARYTLHTTGLVEKKDRFGLRSE